MRSAIMSYEELKKQCDLRIEENERYLDLFDKYLTEAGLSDKTISQHLRNVEFYLNTYLLREGALSMEEGCYSVAEYLGNFFIRKCMWSTPASIKSNAVSLKKFYACMRDHDEIDDEDYQILVDSIKMGMDLWLDDCAVYNDPEADNPFSPF
jgi:hypothetical protein